MNKTEVLNRLALFHNELKKYSIKDLYMFGSYARGDAGNESDIDILIDFEPNVQIGLFTFAKIRRRLSELLDMEVDLVTVEAIRPEMKEEIVQEAVRAA